VDPASVPMIRGELVWLRPLERRDLEAYRQGCTDGETGYLAGYPYPNNEAGIERWFQGVSEQHGRDGFWFTICEHGSDDFIGTCWLWRMSLMHGSAEFSIFIGDKRKWGKGYGTDALHAALDFGFGQLPLERVYLTVDSNNERAIGSYRKVGLVVEGVLRHERRTRGGFRDGILMSILRDEWASQPRRKSWESSGAE
jgi:RimJ/RimL family protein N-acetyltransferase